MHRLYPFSALLRKDLILFLSDRRALIISLLLPIVTASFFGYLFGGAPSGGGGRIGIALVLQDDSAIAQRIAKDLQADPALQVESMALEPAQQAVRKGSLKAAVVLPPGFGAAAGKALFSAGPKPAIGLLYDPSEQAVLSMVKGMLTQHVMEQVSAAMLAGPEGRAFTAQSLSSLDQQPQDARTASLRNLLGSVQAYQGQQATQPGGAGSMGTPFTTTDQALAQQGTNAGYNAYAHSFAGMGVQFVLFLGVDIGIGILLARRSGVWQRLLAAPVSLRTILLARAASAALIATCVMLLLFGFAVLAFGVSIHHLAGLAGVVLCFGVLTACFGLMVAAFGKTPEAARGIAIFATLIMVMLGGAWVPSFVFPQWVQGVSLAMPTRWAIDGMDAMTWRGLGWDAAFTAMGAQLAFAALFALLALWKFRAQQRSGVF